MAIGFLFFFSGLTKWLTYVVVVGSIVGGVGKVQSGVVAPLVQQCGKVWSGAPFQHSGGGTVVVGFVVVVGARNRSSLEIRY